MPLLFMSLVVGQWGLLVAYLLVGKQAFKHVDTDRVGAFGYSITSYLWWPFHNLFLPSARPFTNAGKVIIVAGIGDLIVLGALMDAQPVLP